MPFPIGLALGIGSSIAGGIFGGAQQNAQNKAQERLAKIQYQQALDEFRFNKKSTKRQIKFATEGVAIQRRNIEQQLAYEEATAQQSYRYQMQIQAFDFANQVRAYNKSKQTASQQLSFNNLAYDYAIQDAARFEQEQNVALDFEEKTYTQDFRFNQREQEVNMRGAEVNLQQARAEGQINKQRTYVEGIKAAGEAQARGNMGKNSDVVARAAIAEAGAATAAIIQQVFSAEQNYGLTKDATNLTLERLNDRFYLNKAETAASRVSLRNQTKSLRNRAALDKYQADLNALASILLEPMMPPPIPAPLTLPRPVLQNPLPFDKELFNSIRPKKGITGGQNAVVAGIGAALPGVFNAFANSYDPKTGKFG